MRWTEAVAVGTVVAVAGAAGAAAFARPLPPSTVRSVNLGVVQPALARVVRIADDTLAGLPAMPNLDALAHWPTAVRHRLTIAADSRALAGTPLGDTGLSTVPPGVLPMGISSPPSPEQRVTVSTAATPILRPSAATAGPRPAVARVVSAKPMLPVRPAPPRNPLPTSTSAGGSPPGVQSEPGMALPVALPPAPPATNTPAPGTSVASAPPRITSPLSLLPTAALRPAAAPSQPAAPAQTVTTVPDMAPLEKALRAHLDRQSGTWGVTVIDLPSGAQVGVGDTRVFRSASTMKLPLAMYILAQAASGHANLDQKLTLQPADYQEGTGVVAGAAVGSAHTVQRLLELALAESDNTATAMLLRRFAKADVWAYAERLGARASHQGDVFTATPQDLARLLQQLFTAQALPAPQSAFILDLLSRSSFHDRLEAGVPPGTRVAHKIGSLPGMVHDAGIIWAPGRPFAVVVMNEGVPNEAAAAATVAAIARLAYDFEVGLARAMPPPRPDPLQERPAARVAVGNPAGGGSTESNASSN